MEKLSEVEKARETLIDCMKFYAPGGMDNLTYCLRKLEHAIRKEEFKLPHSPKSDIEWARDFWNRLINTENSYSDLNDRYQDILKAIDYGVSILGVKAYQGPPNNDWIVYNEETGEKETFKTLPDCIKAIFNKFALEHNFKLDRMNEDFVLHF